MFHTVARRLLAVLRSPKFFYGILVFFVIEVLWFVFSAMYPMAFDEEFHFGLIKLYAHHLSPFLSAQPDGADPFGAVARDPSYLYHYLMSFPFRVIDWFTDSETIQVIILRVMNVGLFTGSLLLFRKLLLRIGSSQAFVSVAIAVFVLIPVVPQVAAHVNYDNLFMLLVPLLCLQVVEIVKSFQQQKVNTKALLFASFVSLLISLVKYAGLPFILASVLFVLVSVIRHFRGHYKMIWSEAVKNYEAVSRLTKIVIVSMIVISSVLFVQRYGVNVLAYKTPVPACSAVLTEKQCSAYGPWNRDKTYAQQKDLHFRPAAGRFMNLWLRGMWHRLFFAINGVKASYNNYRELAVPSQTATVLAVVGFMLVAAYWRPLFKGQELLGYLMILSLVYTATLWLDNYEAYRRTGIAVAINGRYLLPILLPLAAVIGRAFRLSLKRLPDFKPYLAVIVLLLFMHGGGVFTFILRSDNSWYWPNQTVRDINNNARKMLAPIIFEGKNR